MLIHGCDCYPRTLSCSLLWLFSQITPGQALVPVVGFAAVAVADGFFFRVQDWQALAFVGLTLPQYGTHASAATSFHGRSPHESTANSFHGRSPHEIEKSRLLILGAGRASAISTSPVSGPAAAFRCPHLWSTPASCCNQWRIQLASIIGPLAEDVAEGWSL